MEFWGVEVKGGTPLAVRVEEDTVIHLSQASLGESKNKAESVPLYVSLDDQKHCLGTLSHQNFPQISFDLVFEKDFELSHNWKNGSVYFCGYRSPMPDEGNYSTEEESEEEEIPLPAAENGKPKTEAENAKSVKVIAAKPDSAKQNVKIAEPSKDQKPEDDDDEEDDSEDKDDSEDEEDSSANEDNSDEFLDESSEEEGEETPAKAEVSKDAGKKRPNESATKTPKAKKSKSVTPEKTDAKKGGHTATPHPAKQGGKAAAQTSKSSGQVKCNSCSKTFNSDQALQSHSKAKHSGK